MADGVGFEPTKSLHPCRFSRPVPSTTRPPIRLLVNKLTHILPQNCQNSKPKLMQFKMIRANIGSHDAA